MKHFLHRRLSTTIFVLTALLFHQVFSQDLPDWIPATNPITLELCGQINEAEPVYEYSDYVTQQQYLLKNINFFYTDGTYISGFKAKWRARPTYWPSFDVDDH